MTFDQRAAAYDAVRPTYPPALFTALFEKTGLTGDATILEIGPGTGQATKPLAEHGFAITAIELGPALAERARKNLKAYSNVYIITGSFEQTSLPQNAYDLIFSATAFHWVDPAYQFTKTYDVLKPDGFLAIVHTEHISDEQGDRFFQKSQPLYQRYGLSNPNSSFRPPKTEDLQPPAVDKDYFKPVYFRAFPIHVLYSGWQYAQLLSTYSSTIAMPEAAQRRFLRNIQQLIESEFDNCYRKLFAMTLAIARKQPA